MIVSPRVGEGLVPNKTRQNKSNETKTKEIKCTLCLICCKISINIRFIQKLAQGYVMTRIGF